MAILAPAELPVVLKLHPDPMKKYVLTMLGHPVIEVELEESIWQSIISTTLDFIAGYCPREQRLAYFMTQPLVTTYPLPKDAYWIQEVQWDPITTNVNDIFGAESYLFNVGNVTGIQNILLDLHLLASYRKFSKKILGTEGHWEVIGEGVGDATTQKIRLYPTPKGAFPVVVLYYPIMTHFRSPQAKLIVSEMLLAESKIVLGRILRKLQGMPSPDGGTIQYDGEALSTEGKEEKKAVLEKALLLGEPDRGYLW